MSESWWVTLAEAEVLWRSLAPVTQEALGGPQRLVEDPRLAGIAWALAESMVALTGDRSYLPPEPDDGPDGPYGAALWIDPARLGGTVAMNGTRLGAEWAADYVWSGMYDELRSGWDYITERQILVACWWVATNGSRKWRQRWGPWADDAHEALARNDDTLPPLPPTKAA